ncbi:MAG: SDR family NAD(P)-dependent oxidoreductase, partial [Hyphomicrobiales bacterium]|nr:SDR family NAD(P)-dependent oxidoreductase [Hyphomicrobiales bacterium]
SSRGGGQATTAVAGGSRHDVAVNLASMSAIRQFAVGLASAMPSLDLLVHNAAIVDQTRVQTEEGFERQFAVNHLAVYLLTNLLMPLLRAARSPRVVVTASQVERHAVLDFDDLHSQRAYSGNMVYARSKLANVMFTYELSQRLGSAPLTVNCLHPGVVRTRLLDSLSAIDLANRPPEGAAASALATARRGVGRALRRARLLAPVRDWAMTTTEGAKTTLFVATDPELDGVSGRYFKDCREASTSPASYVAADRERLWNLSAEMVGVDARWP